MQKNLYFGFAKDADWLQLRARIRIRIRMRNRNQKTSWIPLYAAHLQSATLCANP